MRSGRPLRATIDLRGAQNFGLSSCRATSSSRSWFLRRPRDTSSCRLQLASEDGALLCGRSRSGKSLCRARGRDRRPLGDDHVLIGVDGCAPSRGGSALPDVRGDGARRPRCVAARDTRSSAYSVSCGQPPACGGAARARPDRDTRSVLRARPLARAVVLAAARGAAARRRSAPRDELVETAVGELREQRRAPRARGARWHEHLESVLAHEKSLLARRVRADCRDRPACRPDPPSRGGIGRGDRGGAGCRRPMNQSAIFVSSRVAHPRRPTRLRPGAEPGDEPNRDLCFLTVATTESAQSSKSARAPQTVAFGPITTNSHGPPSPSTIAPSSR